MTQEQNPNSSACKVVFPRHECYTEKLRTIDWKCLSEKECGQLYVPNGEEAPCLPPITFVGQRYGEDGIPKILCLAINQNLNDPEKNENRPSQGCRRVGKEASLRPYRTDSKISAECYGPLAQVVNVSQFLLLTLAHYLDTLETVIQHIAWDNYLKCSWQNSSGAPSGELAWENCGKKNLAILNILKPDFILCFGEKPFGHLEKLLKGKADTRGWTFSASIEDQTVLVGRFDHYRYYNFIRQEKGDHEDTTRWGAEYFYKAKVLRREQVRGHRRVQCVCKQLKELAKPRPNS